MIVRDCLSAQRPKLRHSALILRVRPSPSQFTQTFNHNSSRHSQPLTGTFAGSEGLWQYSGFGPKGVGAICDPKAFAGVVRVSSDALGLHHGVIKVHLVEPCHDPMECPELQIVTRVDFCDKSPFLVVRVGKFKEIP
jgi:hypothetical protein